MTHSDGVGLFITSGRASRWCFHTPSTEGKKGEVTRQSSTSSKAQGLMLALFLIAMSMDLELLPLEREVEGTRVSFGSLDKTNLPMT